MKLRILTAVILSACFLGFVSLSFAENKISILVSGQSYASLYPCSCPKDPTGGVSRRATVIKEIKEKNPNALILESGGSFAGGNYDTNSQTTELDKQRTKYYMQSLEKMGYDAFLVSSEEFNFGDNFLKEMQSAYKLNYLSANLKGSFRPYIIKEVAGIKIAVIGISDAEVRNKTKITYRDDLEGILSDTIKDIKVEKKADLVVVLSYLSDAESMRLLEKMQGIDILISSYNPFKMASMQEVNGAILIHPAWQVRALTKIDLTFSELEKGVELKLTVDAQNINKQSNSISVAIENINLGQDIKDDSGILGIIPGCFKDGDCIKPGHVSKCENAATKEARCAFDKIKTVKLTIIKPKVCKTCNVDAAISRIKTILPELELNYLTEDDPAAKKIIEDAGIKMLPAYLIDVSAGEEITTMIGPVADKKGGYNVFSPAFTGVSYFVNREKIPNRLDVFFDVKTPEMIKILDVLEALKNKKPGIDIRLNFLAIDDPQEGIISKNGKYEEEEFIRSACINKYYPEMLWHYLSCRLSAIDSSWWDDCTVKFGMDSAKIKTCAQSEEGKILLKEMIKLTQELEVVFGPTFLINNQEVLSSQGAPSEEELEKLF